MRNLLVVSFLFTWLVYWSLLLAFPFQSSYQFESTHSFLIELLFFLVVLVSQQVFYRLFGGVSLPSSPPKYDVEKVLRLLCLLSFIGLTLIIADRILIQDVDYSQGVTLARGDWRLKSQERIGFSSAFSLLGNMLFPFAYAGILLALRQSETRRQMLKYVLFYSVAVLSFSFLTGGREGLLVVFLIVLYSALSTPFQRLLARPKLIVQYLACLGLVTVIGSSFFYFRAKAGDVEPDRYSSMLVYRLGGQVDKPICLRNEMDSGVCAAKAAVVATATYFLHSRWIFDELNFLERLHGNVRGATFASFELILKKLRINPHQSETWTKAGYFLSSPGSAYYDFGAPGVCMLGLILGLGIAFARRMGRDSSPLALAVRFIIFSLLITSPLAFAPNFFAFLYTCIALVVIVVLEMMSQRIGGRGFVSRIRPTLNRLGLGQQALQR